MPTYFKEQFHLDQGTAGFSATGYLQVAALVGVILGGALTDGWSRTTPARRITITVIGLCLGAGELGLGRDDGRGVNEAGHGNPSRTGIRVR